MKMSMEDAVQNESEMTVEQWLQIRKDEGLRIDPMTAEVMWTYGLTLDPYGVYPDLEEEYRQIGPEYFARDPGSDIWVAFRDLPDGIQSSLWKTDRSKLAFPAGLFD